MRPGSLEVYSAALLFIVLITVLIAMTSMTSAVVHCLNSCDLLQASKAKCTNHIADFVIALAGLLYALACSVLTNLIHEKGDIRGV